MSELHLIQLRLDMERLYQHGKARGRKGAQKDLGYLVHMVLLELFGSLAPKPFQLKIGNDTVSVLGYSSANIDALKQQAQMTAEPDVLAICCWEDTPPSKPMPKIWPVGHRLGYEVLTYPIRRIGAQTAGAGARPLTKGNKGKRATREVDAWLAEKLRTGEEPASREAVYEAWLRDEFKRRGGADLETVRVEQWRSSSLWRPHHGQVKGASPKRAQVLFRGALQITDSDEFHAMLVRGIGRHRAFGLGMLLLRPL